MNSRKGFTLIEIVTVVGIVAILTAVAMTVYFRSKATADKNICIANLKQIQTVINAWTIDTNAESGAALTKEELVPGYIKIWPKEGTVDYPVPDNIKSPPECPNVDTRPDHKL